MDTTTAPDAAREVEMSDETMRQSEPGEGGFCGAIRPGGGVTCTRPPGHAGDHVAHNVFGSPFARWLANADRDRKAADYDRLVAEVERMRAGLSEAAGRAEEIRDASTLDADDIDGMLTALADEAREVAAGDKPHLLHLADDEIAELKTQLERLTRERDESRTQTTMLREIVLAFWRFAGVADAAESEPWKVNETNSRLWQMRRDLDAAEARAEALEAALREVGKCRDCGGKGRVYPHCPWCSDSTHDRACQDEETCRSCDGDGMQAAVRTALAATPPADLTQHPAGRLTRETLGQAVRLAWMAWAREQAEQKPTWLVPWEELDEPMREVDRRIGEALAALVRRSDAADLTQHPAYRAGVEAAEKIVREEAESWEMPNDTDPDDGCERFVLEACARAIRALLDTKEVRDGE